MGFFCITQEMHKISLMEYRHHSHGAISFFKTRKGEKLDNVTKVCFEKIKDTIEDLVYRKTQVCDLTEEQDTELKEKMREAIDNLKDSFEDFAYEIDYIMSKDFLDEVEESKLDPYIAVGIDYNSYFGGV